MSVGNSNEMSVDYDPITGRPIRPNTMHGTTGFPSPAPPAGSKPAGTRPGGRPGTGSEKSGLEMTSTQCSTNYDPLADGTGHNVDSDAITPLGIEIKERFRSMRDAFLKMDQNRDGRITRKEILSLCRSWNIPTAEAERVLNAADIDHNGTLDFNEFAQRFDPFEGESSFGSSMHGFPAPSGGGGGDNRPIKSSGWDMGAGDEMSMPPPSGRHGGNSGPVGRQAPPPAAGGGAQAVRSLGGDAGGTADECNMLRSRNAELAGQNAALQARNAELEARVAALENIVGQLTAKDADLENALKQRDMDLTRERGAHQDMERALQQRDLDLTREKQAHQSDLDGARAREMAQARAREATAAPAAPAAPAAAAAPAADEEDDPRTVFVYGKDGDPQTEQMYKALRGAGISFEKRNFNTDKRYMKPMKESGFSGGSVKSPVVTRGSKAWWDDGSSSGDEMFSIPFHATVATELRHSLHEDEYRQAAAARPPVRTDADIDTEIAERFKSMQDAFLKLDGDRDGKITVRELMAKCQEWNIPISEAERCLGEGDRDHNGILDFNEFAKRFNGRVDRNYMTTTSGRTHKGHTNHGRHR